MIQVPTLLEKTSSPRGELSTGGDGPAALLLSMSIQLTATVEAEPRADRVFERRIWTHPGICSECYQRIKRIHTRHGKWEREVDVHTRTDDAVLGYDDTDGDGVFRPRTFCRTCGGRGTVHSDILPLDVMVSRLGRLADRLVEEGVRLDRDSLYAFVRRFKAVDELQGSDRELYEAAVWFAIERQRGRLRSKMALQRRLRSGEHLPDLFDRDD